jgi:hypothetical protein
VLAERLYDFRAAVDEPDLVAGGGESSAEDTTYASGADDRGFHVER